MNKGNLQPSGTCAPTNVATNSTNGHFVHNARSVKRVDVDALEETFDVVLAENQEAELRTGNHGVINLKSDCTIFHQDAYDPISGNISARVD